MAETKYSFWVWLDENSNEVKLFVAGMLAVGTYYAAAVPEPWKALIALFGGLFSKWIIDAIHFKANQKLNS